MSLHKGGKTLDIIRGGIPLQYLRGLVTLTIFGVLAGSLFGEVWALRAIALALISGSLCWLAEIYVIESVYSLAEYPWVQCLWERSERMRWVVEDVFWAVVTVLIGLIHLTVFLVREQWALRRLNRRLRPIGGTTYVVYHPRVFSVN